MHDPMILTGLHQPNHLDHKPNWCGTRAVARFFSKHMHFSIPLNSDQANGGYGLNTLRG
jgi:hypothetical protein